MRKRAACRGCGSLGPIARNVEVGDLVECGVCGCVSEMRHSGLVPPRAERLAALIAMLLLVSLAWWLS